MSRVTIRPRAALRFVCLLAGGLIFASVFVYAVLSAVKPPDEVLAMKLWPSEWRWSNFTLPFKQTAFDRYYLNSVVVGISVTALNVVTCTLAGYSFAKFSYRGRNLLFFLVLATLMIRWKSSTSRCTRSSTSSAGSTASGDSSSRRERARSGSS